MKRKIAVLGVSRIHNVGVFTRFPLKKGEIIEVWGGKDCKFVKMRKKKLLCLERPDLEFFFNRYCIETVRGFWCPSDFIRMSVGWYLNHSDKPNLSSDDDGETYRATRNIKRGEELTINYKVLDKYVDNRI